MIRYPLRPGPIGVFDSGLGGMTIFRDIVEAMPQYDYIYLGDNARAPYGVRSFETIYQYTWQCVEYLFEQGCPLIILACNTASAKALRNIQQLDLPRWAPDRRVLGVIRPTTEHIGTLTQTGHVGVVATTGTVQSESYLIEIGKQWPNVRVFQEACPMWVPLIENNEHESDGADFFIKKNLQRLLAQSDRIDTIILGCTHYPLMWQKIRAHTPEHIQLVAQGRIVSERLVDYLSRHPEIEKTCTRGASRAFLTTESTTIFEEKARWFLNEVVTAQHITV
jgi:glutamate racemase